MDYIHIKGTVGKTKVDLQLSIPVEAIVKQLPDTIDAVMKALPTMAEKVETKLPVWTRLVSKLNQVTKAGAHPRAPRLVLSL